MQSRRNRASPSLNATAYNWTPKTQIPQTAPQKSQSQFNNSWYTKPSTANVKTFTTQPTQAVNENKDNKTKLEGYYSLMPKLTQYQSSRSARWAPLSKEIYKSDLNEENQYRSLKISELLKEFLSHKPNLEMASEKEKAEIIPKLYSLGEGILSMYKISLITMSEASIDSIVDFGALTSKSELIRGLLAIIPEVCRFPYSFYTKIDMISLTFCGSMVVVKFNSQKMVEKKLMNGIFPLGALQTDEQIVHHFYKVMVSHLKTEVPDFDQKLSPAAKEVKDPRMSTFTFGLYPHKPKKDGMSLDDQARLIKALITKPNHILHNESEMISSKGRVLKEILQTVDSCGINKNFWLQLGCNDIEPGTKIQNYTEVQLTSENLL